MTWILPKSKSLEIIGSHQKVTLQNWVQSYNRPHTVRKVFVIIHMLDEPSRRGLRSAWRRSTRGGELLGPSHGGAQFNDILWRSSSCRWPPLILEGLVTDSAS